MAPKFHVGDKVTYACHYRVPEKLGVGTGKHIEGEGDVVSVVITAGTDFVSAYAYVIRTGAVGFLVLDESVVRRAAPWKKVKDGHRYEYKFVEGNVYRRLKS